MRFLISRTSMYSKQPCDRAYKAEEKTWDLRTFKSEEEHDTRFPDEPWMISKQLRHSDPSLVLRLYGHPSVDVALDEIGSAFRDRPMLTVVEADDIAF